MKLSHLTVLKMLKKAKSENATEGWEMMAGGNQAQNHSPTTLSPKPPLLISLVGSTVSAQPGRHLQHHPEAGMEGLLTSA